MPPRIDGRFHLSLIGRGAANSAAWYRRVFGFEVVRASGMQTTMPDADGEQRRQQRQP